MFRLLAQCMCKGAPLRGLLAVTLRRHHLLLVRSVAPRRSTSRCAVATPANAFAQSQDPVTRPPAPSRRRREKPCTRTPRARACARVQAILALAAAGGGLRTHAPAPGVGAGAAAGAAAAFEIEPKPPVSDAKAAPRGSRGQGLRIQLANIYGTKPRSCFVAFV